MAAIISEYQYILSRELFVHSIIDYGYYQDDSSNNIGYLLGFGLGMGLQTKNGLLKLAFANGNTKDQGIKFNDSVIHPSYKTSF